MNIEKQFGKRWYVELHSEMYELVPSDSAQMPCVTTTIPSRAVLLQLVPESKCDGLMTEQDFDELCKRLKSEYFTQSKEHFKF